MHTIKVQVDAFFKSEALQQTNMRVWSEDTIVHKLLQADINYQYHKVLTIMATAVVSSFIQMYKDTATREEAMGMYFKHIRLLLESNESVDTIRIPEAPDKN